MSEGIKTILIELGVKPEYAGFKHLVDAIHIAIGKIEKYQVVTLAAIYKEIAENANQPIWNIERRIRVVINQAFENPNDKLLKWFKTYLNEDLEAKRDLYFIKTVAVNYISEEITEKTKETCKNVLRPHK